MQNEIYFHEMKQIGMSERFRSHGTLYKKAMGYSHPVKSRALLHRGNTDFGIIGLAYNGNILTPPIGVLRADRTGPGLACDFSPFRRGDTRIR